MLYTTGFDITYSEIPDETCLTFAISGCGGSCEGCHSPHLQYKTGLKLTEEYINGVLNTYGEHVTTVLLLGGYCGTGLLETLNYIKKKYPKLKLAHYSGKA